MGGFTSIQLKDISQENIDEQNAELDALQVAKRFRFYSENDIKLEYEAFQKGDGNFPVDMFPPEKIHTLEDFKKYWSPEALGSVFVPAVGMLTFDCYFGRTSTRAMHGIARYLLYTFENTIKEVSGSYSTFVERCGYKAKTKQQVLLELE